MAVDRAGNEINPATGQATSNPYNDAQQAATANAANDQAMADTPKPDGWPGWAWNRGTQSWVIPSGQQSAYDQWAAGQSLAAAGTNYANNAPALDPRLDPTGSYDKARANQTPGQVQGQTLPTVDTSQTDQARAARDQALADQRRVLEQSMNLKIDPVEQQALQQRYQERGLAMGNTLAANARGGAGAVAAARGMVVNQTPAIAGQAAEQARNEELQMFQARIQQAQTSGGIANTIGQTATGAFGQEAGLATDSARVGLEAIDRVIADTGMQINADLKGQELLGGMINDINQLGFNYASLDIKTQMDIFDQIAQSHHIDQQVAGQIKAAAEANKKGPMDYVMGFLGAGEKALGAAGSLGWKPLA
jgi:hypothetical protein